MKTNFRRSGFYKAAGFTLIELLVVMFVISLMFGVVVPYVGERTEINLRAEARTLGGAIRFAGGEAVFRRRPTRLYVDFEENRYWVSIWGEDGFEPMVTPLGRLRAPLDGVYLTSLWVEGSIFKEGRAFLQFDPDGGMEEAILTLTNETGDATSLVPDPNTGAAEIYAGGADPQVLFPETSRLRAAVPRGSR